LRPEEGELLFEGQPVTFASPQDARAHGMETVHMSGFLRFGLVLY